MNRKFGEATQLEIEKKIAELKEYKPLMSST